MYGLYHLKRLHETLYFALKTGVISSDDWAHRLLVSKSGAETILSPLLFRYENELQVCNTMELERAANDLAQFIKLTSSSIKIASTSLDAKICTLSTLLSQEIQKYANALSEVLLASSLSIPKDISSLITVHNNTKAISETARKAIATQTENLDAELYPLLEQVIKELQIATPRRAVTSTEGAGYTFIGSAKLYAYLCIKLKETAHIETIPWAYIMGFIKPSKGTIATLKKEASKLSKGESSIPKEHLEITAAIRRTKE